MRNAEVTGKIHRQKADLGRRMFTEVTGKIYRQKADLGGRMFTEVISCLRCPLKFQMGSQHELVST